jgi:predicted nucleotidyltransferase
MVKRRDYSAELAEAARSVLLEIMRVLGEYKNDIVVVGGWVPELLLSQADEKHIGSIDVDLALNHRSMSEAGYKTILELLLSHGYRQGSKQPFIFFRTLVIANREIDVEVDFLAGEYEGTGKKRRTQRVQDMRPRKARGVDLVFDLPVTVTIRGRLPEGGDDSTEIRVASIPAFLVMKAMAMNGRLKEKDAWDIYYCIRHYPGGVDALVEEIRPFYGHGLVQEALSHLSSRFSSPSAVGPTHVVDFDDITDPGDRALRQRDAFERIQYFLNALVSYG